MVRTVNQIRNVPHSVPETQPELTRDGHFPYYDPKAQEGSLGSPVRQQRWWRSCVPGFQGHCPFFATLSQTVIKASFNPVRRCSLKTVLVPAQT